MKKIRSLIKNKGFVCTCKLIANRLIGTSSGIKYLKKNTPSKVRLHIEGSTAFKYAPKISIIVPVYNTAKPFLCDMIDSVLAQSYLNWELCIADASDDAHSYIEDICKGYASVTKQIKYIKLEKNFGISENSNKCIEISNGEYIALLDHDDILHPSALFEVVSAINNKNADFIYTDEASFSQSIKVPTSIHFKPDFAPDTLRSCNYICHFSVFSRKLLELCGTFNSEFDGSQDYDLILRLTEKTKNIVHIPRVLYFWRSHKNSAAAGIEAKPYCVEASKKALCEHLNRLGYYAQVGDSSAPTTYKIDYMISGTPLVSIIIPSCDNITYLNRCLKSIYKLTNYKNFEIVVVENNSSDKDTFDYYKEIENIGNIRVVNKYGNFNYSLAIKFALEHARGDYLLLLDNDTEVISPNWIEEMLMFAQRTDVGAVGAKLYDENNKIQHAGLVLGMSGSVGSVFKGLDRKSNGYFSRLTFVQNVSAVSASCMMISRQAYEEVGGFDDKISHQCNYIDLCLKLREKGYLNVFTPYAQLYHFEAKTKCKINAEKEYQLLAKRWGNKLKQDPYYNPNLSLDKTDCSIKV